MRECKFKSGESLLAICKENGMKISEVMAQRELIYFEGTREENDAKMKKTLDVMIDSTKYALEKKLELLGGFIGGEGKALYDMVMKNGAMGGMISKATAYAMSVIEYNASMGRIVAAPTAGSSGIIPGVLRAAKEKYSFSDDELVLALYNTGAVGYIIARGATLSGAEGGCQAEVGAASAMASSALCELLGGSPEQCLCAAGDAISNILGLVCDPVCGLVEFPCQKRNAMGVSNAVTCAEIALSGNGKSLIPFDQTVEVMRDVGRSIPYQLRETALGGLATAPCVNGMKCSSCK